MPSVPTVLEYVHSLGFEYKSTRILPDYEYRRTSYSYLVRTGRAAVAASAIAVVIVAEAENISTK